MAEPQGWHVHIGRLDEPQTSPFESDWPTPVWFEDRERRLTTLLDADIRFSLLFGDLSNLFFSRSTANVENAVRAEFEARQAFSRLGAESMFRDPFGQPEPRTALFSYARAATTMQFLAKPADRRTIATEASALLERRMTEWEELQRARLAGKSPADVQEAVESIGAPELRRLIAAWRGIEGLAFRPLDK